MFAFTHSQVVEQPVRSGLLPVAYDMEVLAYPDMIVDASCVQIARPFASDKLTVSHQVVDGVLSGETDEPVYKFYSLLCIGVAPIIHHLEYDRERHAVIDDAKGENVYVGVTELPVRPVQRKVGSSGKWVDVDT